MSKLQEMLDSDMCDSIKLYKNQLDSYTAEFRGSEIKTILTDAFTPEDALEALAQKVKGL
jgi:hypothetical protein